MKLLFGKGPKSIKTISSYGTSAHKTMLWVGDPNTSFPETAGALYKEEGRLKKALDGFCMQNQLKEAVNMLYLMNQQGIPTDSDICASLLQGCINIKSLTKGKQVMLSSDLWKMRAKCLTKCLNETGFHGMH